MDSKTIYAFNNHLKNQLRQYTALYKTLRTIGKFSIETLDLINLLKLIIRSFYSPSDFPKSPIVCCMANLAQFGGSELQIELITQYLAASNLSKFMIIIGELVGGKNNEIVQTLARANVKHISMKYLTSENHAKKEIYRYLLSLLLIKMEVKILFIFNPASLFLATIAKPLKISIVYFETGLPDIKDSWSKPLITHISNIDQVVSVSTLGLNILHRDFGYTKKGTVILPLIKKNLGLDARAPIERVFHIIYVGRMFSKKGVSDLIQAFYHLKKIISYAHLTLVGEGPALENFKREVHALSLQNSIFFTGKLDHEEIMKLAADADIFCLPSFTEGTPCSILETMSIGLPIVATNVGGIPEIVQNRKTGILVNVHDIAALSKALIELGLNPDLRKSYGINGRDYYQNKLIPEVSINKLLALSQKLLLKK